MRGQLVLLGAPAAGRDGVFDVGEPVFGAGGALGVGGFGLVELDAASTFAALGLLLVEVVFFLALSLEGGGLSRN